MPTIKTLVCEIRKDGECHHDDSLFDGSPYRNLNDDGQIIENTNSPVLASAEALSTRGHAPDTLFALRDCRSNMVRWVTPIGRATV